MADTTDNLPISILGGDALLASDIMTNDGETYAHAQIFKTAWGDDNFTYKVNATTPMPVRIYGSSGDSNRVTVTGGVFGLGSFTVSNTYGSPIFIASGMCGPMGITGTIQGFSGAYPVNITGAVSILGNVGITGLVSVTGGRSLTFGTDSIRVFGEIGTTRGWKLTAANDVVTVSPLQGGYTHSTYLAGPSGQVIGASGDALKVFVSNVGLSLTATLSPVVYVQNATGDIFRIRGTTWVSETNPTPVIIRGTKAAESAYFGNDVGDAVISFKGAQPVILSSVPNADITSSSNLYRYLHGGTNPGVSASIGVNISSIQTLANTIANRLSNAVPTKSRNDTSQNASMRNWFVTLAANDAQARSISNPSGNNNPPIQGTHIKNLTYLRSTNDPPPVTIGIGTLGGTAANLSLYLDPGESVFIPMSVSNLYAKIIDKSVNANYTTQVYGNALGIMSI